MRHPRLTAGTSVRGACALATALVFAACDSPMGSRSEGDLSRPGALSTRAPQLTPASQLSADELRGPWGGASLSVAPGATTASAVAGSTAPSYYILWQNKVTGDRGMWPMEGAFRSGGDIALPKEDPVWDMAAIADFTGDGDPEILFQNKVTGNRGMWSLKGTTWNRWIQLFGEKPEWDFAAVADFTGDQQPDIVLQNTTTGQRGFWWMNRDAYHDWIAAPTEQPAWRMAAAGDFSGDGRNDILFENTSTGQRGIWVMTGTKYHAWGSLTTEDPVWQMVAAHDVSGDGKPDILFQNKNTGLRGWWIMNGTRYQTWVALGTVSTEWEIVGTFATGAPAPRSTGPGAPSNLISTTNLTGAVQLTWVDNSSFEEDFVIQRSVGDANSWVLIAQLPANSTTYSDPRTDVTQATYYRVRSCTVSACTDWSNVATARVDTSPQTPTAVTGGANRRDGFANQVVLSGLFAEGFTATQMRFDVSRTLGFESFQSYPVASSTSPSNTQQQRVVPVEVTAGDTARYYYRAVATKSRGTSMGAVRYFQQRTPAIGGQNAFYEERQYRVTVRWSVRMEVEPNLRATQQFVDRRDPATGATVRFTLPANAETLVDSTFPLQAGRRYSYTIQACNSFGCTRIPMFDVPTTALPAPSNVQAASVTPSVNRITWSANGGYADRYAIHVRTSTGFSGIRGYVSGSVTSYDDPEVSLGTTYWYRVQALRDTRASFLSDEAVATAPGPTAAPSTVTTSSAKTSPSPTRDTSWNFSGR